MAMHIPRRHCSVHWPISREPPMTQDEILSMFRQHAAKAPTELPPFNEVILKLATLLADSCGRLSKENFDTLVWIGGILYKEGNSRFQARSDVSDIMKLSAKNQGPKKKPAFLLQSGSPSIRCTA